MVRRLLLSSGALLILVACGGSSGTGETGGTATTTGTGGQTSSSGTGGGCGQDQDCPPSTNPCQAPKCDLLSGRCTTSNKTIGTDCYLEQNPAAKVCDGEGNCVPCNVPDDCTRMQHSIKECTNHQCVFVACLDQTTWNNCDNKPDNGCETHLKGDPNNCGACGNRVDAAEPANECQVHVCDNGQMGGYVHGTPCRSVGGAGMCDTSSSCACDGMGACEKCGPSAQPPITLQPGDTIAGVANGLQPGQELLVPYRDGGYIEDVILNVGGTPGCGGMVRITGVSDPTGRRPVIVGTGSYLRTVTFNGDNIWFKNFEIRNTCTQNPCGTEKPGVPSGLFLAGDNIFVENVWVHGDQHGQWDSQTNKGTGIGCLGHGIIGADGDDSYDPLSSNPFPSNGAGSVSLKFVEVSDCGGQILDPTKGQDPQDHSIYMSAAKHQYASSVFLMEFSYVHDSRAGNNVKSRAVRNNLYYNWIEGANFYELDLIGSEEYVVTQQSGENGDVVGNVLRHTQAHSPAVSVGGDGSGDSWGQFRFVNNTFVFDGLASLSAVRARGGINSVSLYNNVFSAAGQAVVVLEDTNANWVDMSVGAVHLLGANNVFPSSSKVLGATVPTSPAPQFLIDPALVIDDPGFGSDGVTPLPGIPPSGSPLHQPALAGASALQTVPLVPNSFFPFYEWQRLPAYMPPRCDNGNVCLSPLSPTKYPQPRLNDSIVGAYE